MKKFYFSLFLAASVCMNAQQLAPCATYNAMEKHFANDPAAKNRFDKVQKELKKQFNKNAASKVAAVQYTIPIVFHVLHMAGAENVSDASLIAALAQVNMDYARTSPDASTVAQPYQNLYINSDIKFVLPTKDPNGNCTNGITHTWDTRTNWLTGSANYTGITWDPTKYLNVIIVKSIDPGSGIIGYTYLPGTYPLGSDADAIVYAYNFISGLDIRSLSHEIGHWFNLPHTFGNSNNPGIVCGDDGIADTPATKGTYACPSSTTGNICDALQYDNVENIMNYSSCPKNFTTDQTNVMRAAAQSTLVGRDNLWSASNLTLTGVTSTPNCAPICDFHANFNSYTVCLGGSITMKDFSYNAPVTSYSWTASGATIASPSASQTAMTFTTAGTSVVTLTVTNGQGSSTKTRSVTVLNNTSTVIANYGESFEAAGLPPGWTITNPNGGSIAWDQTTLGSSNGTQSYFIEGGSDVAGHIDYLNMPSLDVLNHPNNKFTFKYAYARQDVNNNDVFKVQASINCGGTWMDLVQMSAANMAAGSGGTTTFPLVPDASQWKFYDLSDPNNPLWFLVQNSSGVQFRFVFIEDQGGIGFGNRFFLDEVVFADPNGMKENSLGTEFKLFPNPCNGKVNLEFSLNDLSQVNISVTNVLGQTISNEQYAKVLPGEHKYALNSNGTLGKGIYFVKLEVNGSMNIRKLIIE
jgi:hypothetical protein